MAAFDPRNPIVQICLQAMTEQESGSASKARTLLLQAWDQSSQNFEKFISAYFLARLESDTREKLRWIEVALAKALEINDDSVRSALPGLYSQRADCLRDLGHADAAEQDALKAASPQLAPSDPGPFYHGTRADLKVGDLLTPGGVSNYRSELKMNHIYFTGILSGAGLAAALAQGEANERIYVVTPTGPFENDPNVTNQKFPGNPTRSYRSGAPLRIVGEVREWNRLTPEETAQWRQKLASGKGEIIN